MKKSIKVLALAVVMLTVVAMLASCGGPAKDPSKALEALKKNDYTAERDDTIIPLGLALVGVEGIDCVVSGTKLTGDEKGHVTIVYFDSADEAEAAFEKVEKYAKDNEDDDEESDWVIERKGAMIYYGNSAGIKAAG